MSLDEAKDRVWQQMNDEMRAAGFTWGFVTDKGVSQQYLLQDLYRMEAAQQRRILQATREIGQVFQKTFSFLQNSPALYPSLSLPENTWAAVQVPSRLFSYLTRLDLIVNGDDIRVIEVNCDTPTGFVESAVANRIACAHFGVTTPNHIEEGVHAAFQMWIEESGIGAEETIYFTSYSWHEEDRQTTEFLRRCCGWSNTKYVPINELQVDADGVTTTDGAPIRYLYRLYPLEYFSADKGPAGEPIGDLLLEHVAARRLCLFNPPGAFLCQVKTTLAVIWALHEAEHPLFTTEEHAIIERHFLPTYLNREPLAGVAHVEKPVWGREGGGVSIIRADGSVHTEDRTAYYYHQQKIYQRYVEMPTVTVQTWQGESTGSLLVGSFLLRGESAGLFLRVGGEITGNLALFLPITVDEAQRI